MKEDKKSVTDQGKSPILMEPMLIAEGLRFRGKLADLALELATSSIGFRRSLPEGVMPAMWKVTNSIWRSVTYHVEMILMGEAI